MSSETTKEDISFWFNLQAYEPAKNLNLEGWYRNLSARARILELLRLEGYEDRFPREYIAQKLILLLVAPIITVVDLDDSADKSPNANLSIVQPVSMLDAIGVVGDVRKGLWGEHIKEMDEIYITLNSERVIEAEDALEKLPVEIHNTPLNPNKIDPVVWVNVDLNSSDSEIKVAFNLWLKNVRSNVGDDTTTSKRHRKLKQFSRPAMQSWYTNRILPYLDLMLWSEYRGNSFTDEMLGAVIFPEQGESAKTKSHRDCTRAISDTVKPLAWQLISEKILTRMMNLI